MSCIDMAFEWGGNEMVMLITMLEASMRHEISGVKV